MRKMFSDWRKWVRRLTCLAAAGLIVLFGINAYVKGAVKDRILTPQEAVDLGGVAADPRRYGGQKIRDAREILARVKDVLYTIAKPEPTYLGNAIPVNGNGDATNDNLKVN